MKSIGVLRSSEHVYLYMLSRITGNLSAGAWIKHGAYQCTKGEALPMISRSMLQRRLNTNDVAVVDVQVHNHVEDIKKDAKGMLSRKVSVKRIQDRDVQ